MPKSDKIHRTYNLSERRSTALSHLAQSMGMSASALLESLIEMALTGQIPRQKINFVPLLPPITDEERDKGL